jgi:hypothetical protein
VAVGRRACLFQPATTLAVTGHDPPGDPEIEREHRRSHEDAKPNVPPEAPGVLIAAQGGAGPHRHDPGPNAEVGKQPERNDEELEGADEELKQERTAESPGRHRERDERNDDGPDDWRDAPRLARFHHR